MRGDKLAWKCTRNGCKAHGIGDQSMFKHSEAYGDAIFRENFGQA